jgi:hypothetical protein
MYVSCFLQELMTKENIVKINTNNSVDFFITVVLMMTLKCLETLRQGCLQRDGLLLCWYFITFSPATEAD